jgi:hypothetical protein
MFESRRPEPRSPQAILLSVAIHVVIGAGLLRVVLGVSEGRSWFSFPTAPKATEERLVYVAPRPAAVRVGTAGGGSPIVAGARRVPTRSGPLVAPTTTPGGIEAVSGQGGSGGGTGTGIGLGSGSGVSTGIVPNYDPRLNVPPAVPLPVARTQKEQLDSVIAERFARYQDSVTAAGGGRRPGDLTFKKGGKTYGWNERGIVLGDVTIPAPLIALLALNRAGSNGQAFLRREDPAALRAAIQEGAQRAITADEFRERVKRIRERRDKEREAARKSGEPVAVPATQQQER